MNGGGPLAAPLRAVRHPPVLVDDVAVLPRIARAALEVLGADAGQEQDEIVRWTRAWLVVWQGALHERGVIGAVPPWTVALPLAELPSLKGDPDRRRRSAALSLLERSGVATLNDTRLAATLSEQAFVDHRAGLELDWAALCRAVRYEPAPLLVARALADLVIPADEPTAVSLRELADRTGYAPKQARIAVRRLIESEVVRARETAGAATQYWFARPAAGSPPQSVAPPAGLARVPTQPPIGIDAAAVAPPPAAGTRAGRSVALRMTLNGVTLSIGAGLAPHVELGPDGVPHVSFDEPLSGS